MQHKEIFDLSDEVLVAQFQDCILEEREQLVLSLEYLIELDRRKLFYHYPSLRAFLVQELGLEESCAERRIRAARFLKKFPEILGGLKSGKLNLSLLELVQSCAFRESLSRPEILELLDSVSGMSCRAARLEIATLYPDTCELPKDKILPLNDEFSEVRFVVRNDLIDQLDEIRALLAHSHPKLNLGELFKILVLDYLTRHHPAEKAKRAKERQEKKQARPEYRKDPFTQAQPTSPRAMEDENDQDVEEEEESPPWPDDFEFETLLSSSFHKNEPRTHSSKLRNELIDTQGYVCSYIDDLTQKRCNSVYALEIDHRIAWSKGGKTELSNLRFLCRAHHARVSFLEFGGSSKYYSKTCSDSL